MNLSDLDFIAFDLETTGLSPAFNHIVEVGAVRFSFDGTELGRMQELVNPGSPIPAEVTKVHGITDEMVSSAPSIKEVLKQFFEFIDSDNTILIAHNASFDVSFLSHSVTKTGLPIPENMVIDNLMLARYRVKNVESYRLDSLARHYDVANTTDHRALSDSIVLKSVFLNVLKEEPPITELDNILKHVSPMKIEAVDIEPLSIPEKWLPMVQVIEKKQSITIYYEGGNGHGSKRLVSPLNIIQNKGHLYINAKCHIDDRIKHFRLDRVLEVWWE